MLSLMQFGFADLFKEHSLAVKYLADLQATGLIHPTQGRRLWSQNLSRQPERTFVIGRKAGLGGRRGGLHGLHLFGCGIEQRPNGGTKGVRIALGGERRPVANPDAGKPELFRVETVSVEEVQDFCRVIRP